MSGRFSSGLRLLLLAGAVGAGVVLSLAILAGFFGDTARVFDSLSHFRAHFGVMLLVLALGLLAARAFVAGIAFLPAAGLALATTYPFILPMATTPASAQAPRYRLLQMNLRFNAQDRTGAIRRIAETSPDVVTLQEVTTEWREALAVLRDRYPFQTYCNGDYSVGNSAILSRRPFANGNELCQPRLGFVLRQIDFGGVPVGVGSVHLEWPWPHGHWNQIGILQTLDYGDFGPLMVIGGDFNAAAWSAAVRTIGVATGTEPIPGIGPTWLQRRLPSALAHWIGLPIDNVLASPGIRIIDVNRPEPTGSDHLPVLVTFTVELPMSDVQVVESDTSQGN